MRLLVFNAGSSSLKFDLLDIAIGAAARRVTAGSFAESGGGSGRYVLRTAAPSDGADLRVSTLAQAAESAL